MIGSALALGALIAVPLMLAGGIRPRSWQSQVQETTRATWDDVSGTRGSVSPSSTPSDAMVIELDAPIAAPEEVELDFQGFLLPGDDREEAPRAGS